MTHKLNYRSILLILLRLKEENLFILRRHYVACIHKAQGLHLQAVFKKS